MCLWDPIVVKIWASKFRIVSAVLLSEIFKYLRIIVISIVSIKLLIFKLKNSMISFNL